MKTPFVADMPNILVVHASAAIIGSCKSVAPALGMPVRVASDVTSAADLVRAMRPLVLVCDASAGAEDASAIAHLASTIDAVTVQLDGRESTEDVTAVLREACVQAEAKRREGAVVTGRD